MGAERRERGLRTDRGATIATQLSLVRDVQRVDAEDLAGAATSGRTGTASSSIAMPTPEARAISLSAVATPPRVGSLSTRMPGAARAARAPARAAARCRSRSSASSSRSSRASSIAMPCSPSGPRRAPRRRAGRARPRARTPARHARRARRGDEDAVGLAALHHLGVAGDDRDACLGGGRRHRLDDPAEVGDREAFLENEAHREVQRRGARIARSLTVPCTASLPMSPPGKNSGLDDVASRW